LTCSKFQKRIFEKEGKDLFKMFKDTDSKELKGNTCSKLIYIGGLSIKTASPIEIYCVRKNENKTLTFASRL